MSLVAVVLTPSPVGEILGRFASEFQLSSDAWLEGPLWAMREAQCCTRSGGAVPDSTDGHPHVDDHQCCPSAAAALCHTWDWRDAVTCA